MNQSQLSEQLAVMQKRLKEQMSLAEAGRQRVNAGQGTDLEQAADITLTQETDNPVAFIRLQLIQVRQMLGDPGAVGALSGLAPPKAYPAAAPSAG